MLRPFSSAVSTFRVGAANLMSEDIKVSLIGDRPTGRVSWSFAPQIAQRDGM